MTLVQFKALDGARKVGLVSEDDVSLQVLRDASCVYELALETSRAITGLERGKRASERRDTQL